MQNDFKDVKVLTIQQVADFLQVHRSTVSRLAMSGELKSYLIGNRRLFRADEILAFFDNQVDRKCVVRKES